MKKVNKYSFILLLALNLLINIGVLFGGHKYIALLIAQIIIGFLLVIIGIMNLRIILQIKKDQSKH